MSSTIQPTAVAPAGTWTFDPTHSAVGFAVTYMGVAPFRGAFTDIQATLDADGLRGVAQASSIDVDNEQLAEHLASPEFFDVAKYPEIRFEAGRGSRDGDRVTYEGVLELKGNRAPVTLTGTIADPVSDPWGNSKVGLTLRGTVDKNAVGLTWNAPLPEGGSMIGDEVALEASLVFVQAAESEA
jgi:polyisoprenoid-binding protein YceI